MTKFIKQITKRSMTVFYSSVNPYYLMQEFPPKNSCICKRFKIQWGVKFNYIEANQLYPKCNVLKEHY